MPEFIAYSSDYYEGPNDASCYDAISALDVDHAAEMYVEQLMEAGDKGAVTVMVGEIDAEGGTTWHRRIVEIEYEPTFYSRDVRACAAQHEWWSWMRQHTTPLPEKA